MTQFSNSKECNDIKILAIDIGTSSVRAIVFDSKGSIYVRKQAYYKTIIPHPGMEEQDPLLIRKETYRIIAEALQDESVDSNSVKGISFSSQMYGIFPVDYDGNPLYNNIIWSDSRALKYANDVKKTDTGRLFYNKTGCRPNSMFPIYKIKWLKENYPNLEPKTYKYISIKEFILYPLLENWVVDFSMASATGLLDINKKDWSEEALNYAGISVNQLSRLTEGTTSHALVSRSLLELWGLQKDTLIFCGGGDGPLANIGSGASSPGSVNIDLGTSGAARAVVDRPTIDSKESLWCFCLTENLWVSGGILTNVGNAYNWLNTNIANLLNAKDEITAMQQIDSLASKVEVGSNGLFFLPYLRKARSPHWNDNLVGTLYGLEAEHTVGHIAKALYEAILYDIAIIIEIIGKKVPIEKDVVLTGGLSKNKGLAQMLAHVLQKNVLIPANSEGSISGAAIFGFYGLGILKDFKFKKTAESQYTIYSPDSDCSDAYKDLRYKYSQLVTYLSSFEFIQR